MLVKTNSSVRDGMIVGVIGYASVAVFYSAFDFLASRGSLYTVNLLGQALFRGLRDPSVLMFPLAPDWGAIMMYNSLHLAAAPDRGRDHRARERPAADTLAVRMSSLWQELEFC